MKEDNPALLDASMEDLRKGSRSARLIQIEMTKVRHLSQFLCYNDVVDMVIPKSMNEIYNLSNANRRCANKEKSSKPLETKENASGIEHFKEMTSKVRRLLLHLEVVQVITLGRTNDRGQTLSLLEKRVMSSS